MYSFAPCNVQERLCGHEKVMFAVVLLAAIGLEAYFPIS